MAAIVGISMEGLRTEQAPPLSIPISFFLTAPLALVAAGLGLLLYGALPLGSRWAPQAMAIAHLGSLGFLGAVMLGALYQMIPVVAGVPVPMVRLARAVHAALVVGIAALVSAFVGSGVAAYWLGAGALAFALLLFGVPVAVALVRAPARDHITAGLRLAVLGLFLLAVLGLTLALGHAGIPWVRHWMGWLYAHIGMGLTVWVGALIASVSWQVIPMFYLTDAIRPVFRRTVLWSIRATMLALVVAVGLGASAWTAALAVVPAAVAVWLVHPLSVMLVVRTRRRKRSDASLMFWRFGLVCAPVALALGTLAVLHPDPRWPVLFGWVALWGWAGLIVHGMLTRIVPFLVWFHRCAPLVGRAPVLPMRRLLPDRRARMGLLLHLVALLLGVVAILSGWALVARLTGAALTLTGVGLAVSLGRVVAYRP